MNLLEAVFSFCCIFLGCSSVCLITMFLSFIKENKNECSFDEYLESLDKDFYYDEYNVSGDYFYKDAYTSKDIIETAYRVI